MSKESSVIQPKDFSLSAIRMIATVMVVTLHISQAYEQILPAIHIFTDWLEWAIPMFFCITATIYAKRTIDNPGRWFLHRYIEIIVPSVLVGITVIVIRLISGSITASGIPTLLLSIFGFQAFLKDSMMFFHLWFITDILICYAAIPFLQRISYKEMSKARFIAYLIAPVIIMQALFSLIKMVTAIQLPGANALSCFYIAYAYQRRRDIFDEITRRVFRVLTIVAVPLIAFTAYVRYVYAPKAEGLVASLCELIFLYTIIVVGYVCFYWLRILFNSVNIGKAAAVLTVSDRLSLPIYLTHCVVIPVIRCFDSFALGTAVMILCRFAASALLQAAAVPVKRFFNRLI